MPRPNVSPRPVCKYFNMPRGCFSGARCHYLHGDPEAQKCAPYEENKICRFYAEGFCKRGFECWFRHVDPPLPGNAPDADDTCQTNTDLSCGICFEERPAIYGLLSDCSHGFCLDCIRQWRDPESKEISMTDSGIHKTCPMCRKRTKFIVPSSAFYKQGDPRKNQIVQKYKESMAKVPCRYFINSPPKDRYCPFGSDCFYQHLNEDGTTHVFKHGVDVMMKRLRRRTARQLGETAGASHTPVNPASDSTFQAVFEVLGRVSDSLAQEERNGSNDMDSRMTVIATHVREMMRIMTNSPVLRTLDILERITGAGPEEEEDEEPPALVPIEAPTEEAPPEAGSSAGLHSCDH